VRTVWSIKIDGFSFSFHWIRALASLMEPPSSSLRKMLDHVGVRVWERLSKALEICKDPTVDVVNMLAPFDWTTTLNHKDDYTDPRTQNRNDQHQQQRPGECLFRYPDNSKVLSWVALHSWALRALQLDAHSPSGRLLLDKIGNAFAFTKRMLQNSLALGGNPHVTQQSQYDSHVSCVTYFFMFFHTLTPIPTNDRQLDKLVKRSASTLQRSAQTLFITEDSVNAPPADLLGPDRGPSQIQHFAKMTIALLQFFDKHGWEQMKRESFDVKWQRLVDSWLHREEELSPGTALAKQYKKEGQNLIKRVVNNLDELCANCFVAQSSLNLRLRRCGRCRQIKYCSEDCQTEHWKKSHKLHCGGNRSGGSRKAGDDSTLSSSKPAATNDAGRKS